MFRYKNLLDDEVRHLLRNIVADYNLTANHLDGLDDKIKSLPYPELVLQFAAIKIKFADGLDVLQERKASVDITDLLCAHLTHQNDESSEDLINILEDEIADHYVGDFVEELTEMAHEEHHEEMFEAGYRLSHDQENGELTYVRN